jgi:hypothetical protein
VIYSNAIIPLTSLEPISPHRFYLLFLVGIYSEVFGGVGFRKSCGGKGLQNRLRAKRLEFPLGGQEKPPAA